MMCLIKEKMYYFYYSAQIKLLAHALVWKLEPLKRSDL